MTVRPSHPGAAAVLAALTLALPPQPSFAAEAAAPSSRDFELHPDLVIQRFAAEPEVIDPVSVSVDENGRVYVAEMRDYPYGIGPDHAPGGTIRWLEDRDGDGRADRSGIFAEGIRFPTSVLAWKGGVLVTAAPDILFLKDTDGDGKADVREVVLTGFQLGVTDSNLSGLRRGLDNWVHAVNGGNGGRITSPKRASAEPVALGDRDLRFQPDTGEFELTSHTGGGFGLVFDEWGRSFTPHNVNHIQQRVADADDFLRVAGMPAVETTHSISDHGEMARIFPISEAVTRPNHPEQAGHFSSSGGMGYLGHRGWPKTLQGGVLVCDVVGNLVHRDVLGPDGPILRASRAPEEQTREFVASREPQFRPVGLEPGPGGVLYLIDMQRAVIEHPDYIPKPMLEKVDIRAGDDRGRLYALRPRGWGTNSPGGSREKLPGAATAAERVAMLASPDFWVRGTAQRLLVDGGGKSVIERLERVATGRERLGEGELGDLARLHAAWTLEGLGALSEAAVGTLLEASHPRVRENAVEMARARVTASPGVRGRLVGRLQDDDAAVRFRAALALSLAGAESAALSDVVGFWERDHAQAWSRRAGLALAGTRAVSVLETWLTNRVFCADLDDARGSAVRELAALGMASGERLDRVLALAALEGLSGGTRHVLLEGMVEGVGRRGDGVSVSAAARAMLDGMERGAGLPVRVAVWRLRARVGLPESPGLGEALQDAERVAVGGTVGLEERLGAIHVLALGRIDATADVLLKLLDGAQPRELQQASFDVLRQHREMSVARGLINAWPGLAPALRPAVVNLLVYRPAFHEALMDALESGGLRVGELNLDLEHRRQLLRKAAPGIRARAAKFTSDEEYSNRSAVVDHWLVKLPRTGDGAKGKGVFERLCASCHVAYGIGHPVGPELTRQNHRSVEDLAANILDPNMAMNPAYVAFTAEVSDGEPETGVLSSETPQMVTLLQALGRRVEIPRQRLKRLQSDGKSLMPEGLEAGLTPADLRDLIAYLQEGEGSGGKGGGTP